MNVLSSGLLYHWQRSQQYLVNLLIRYQEPYDSKVQKKGKILSLLIRLHVEPHKLYMEKLLKGIFGRILCSNSASP